MVTARPLCRLLRTRRAPAGSLRVLGLVVLLLGLLYSHGLSGESTAAHTTGASSATGTSSATGAFVITDAFTGTPTAPPSNAPASAATHRHEPGPGHHDSASGHAAQDCLSGQPQHGLDLPDPCTAVFGTAAFPAAPRGAVTRWGAAQSPPPTPPDPAILRI